MAKKITEQIDSIKTENKRRLASNNSSMDKIANASFKGKDVYSKTVSKESAAIKSRKDSIANAYAKIDALKKK